MAFTTHYFTCAYNPGKRLVTILATCDQMDSDAAFTYLGGYSATADSWGSFHWEGIRATAYAFHQLGDGAQQLWLTGDRGEIWVSKQGQITKGQLPDSGLDGRELGQPNDIRIIAGVPYVCGFAGQVYTLSNDKWVHMDDGLAEPTGNPDSIDLESIDGTAANDIYVCGSGGLIAHWDGKAWTKVPVLTNVYLARIRCFAKDHIVAVGNNGVVIESDGKAWKVDRIPGAEETPLSDVVMYKDRLYVGALGRLYVKDGDAWVEVRHGLPKDKSQFLRFCLGEDRLWAMGATRLSSFDGKVWRSHPDLNNK